MLRPKKDEEILSCDGLCHRFGPIFFFIDGFLLDANWYLFFFEGLFQLYGNITIFLRVTNKDSRHLISLLFR